jgi:glycosyltransferase involved in cell wall biosynthesis
MSQISNSRLLFVAQFFPAPDGAGNTGGTISNLNMLRTLAQKNAVTVISFDPTSPQEAFSNEPFRVLSRPAPVWRALGLMHHWLDFVRNETQAAISKKQSPDAVIATTSTLAAFDVCPSDIRRVALVRAYENFGLRCPWVPIPQRINLSKLAAVRRFQDSRMMRNADAVLTNSHFMRTAISKRFKISPEHIHVLLQDCAMRDLSAAPPPNTIGFVNRGAEKGLSFVLDLARLSADMRYLIYGHERGRPDVLPENVEWRGWASDRNEMFDSAKLWLVPSLWAEPFGRVSIEAQAADRAVLVANTGGLPETVLESRFRMQGFDAGEWLTRMRDLLEVAPDYLQQNGSKIRKIFSSEAHDERVLEVINRILIKHKGHSDV